MLSMLSTLYELLLATIALILRWIYALPGGSSFLAAFFALVATFYVGYNALEWVAENFEHTHKPRRWTAAAIAITLYAAAMWFAISLSVCAGIAILLCLASFLPITIFRISHGRVAQKKDVLCVPGWLEISAIIASFVMFLLVFTCFRPDADHAVAFLAPFKWALKSIGNPLIIVGIMAVPCCWIGIVPFVVSCFVRTHLEKTWPERFHTRNGRKIDLAVGLAIAIPFYIFFLSRVKW